MADPRLLLDSNIMIYVLSAIAPAVRARFEECEVGSLATSSIAYAEVMLGARKLDAEARAERMFEVVSIVPFDAKAALAYARLPFKRARFDRLIAAHALTLGLPLITNNERDFAGIPGLKVENWTL